MNASDEPNSQSPARVLALVSESIVGEQVRLALSDPRIRLREARDRTEAIAVLDSLRPDLAIVDIDLQPLGGIAALSRRLPIVALTRHADLATRLAAFAGGADDVLVVPFAPEELLARALALIRRQRQTTTFDRVARCGALEIDMLRGRVRVGSAEVQLTPTERSLLYLLVVNTGTVLSRDEILDTLWGTDHAAESNVVDQHVRNLRAKLQAVARRGFMIATVPGRGYRFLVDEEVESGPASQMSESGRHYYPEDVGALAEFDFDRVLELDERRAPPGVAAIAA